MVGDPRDRTAYSMAIASLGVALALLLVGICWIVVEHSSSTEFLTHRCPLVKESSCRPAIQIGSVTKAPAIPRGLWIALAGLAGIFVGALISFPLSPSGFEWPERILYLIATVVIFLAGVLLVATVSSGSSLLGLAIGGILLGLLIPSPTRRD
jgi:hypothetical protein